MTEEVSQLQDIAGNLVGNSVLGIILLLIVRWLLAHFDRREANRAEEQKAVTDKMERISATLIEVGSSLRENTREHAQIVQGQKETLTALRQLHQEIGKCDRRRDG